MGVSVVMPSRNAAATLSRALESLAAQTFSDWEAIVVDDGSTDATAELGSDWSRRDARVSLLEQPHRGVSAARNAGIETAHHPLLLFLDADDELLPRALELLVGALGDHGGLAGAYGRWARVTPSGRVVELEPAVAPSGDLFPLLATHCVFAIHTCVVRRDAVERVGSFDVGLRTCEDWDLWQRIARAGGRFAYVPETVALYHLSATSASSDPTRLLADGLFVTRRGHGADPRLAALEQAYPEGAPAAGLAAPQTLVGCWSAGLAVADGKDPLHLLDSMPTGPIPDLDPEQVGITMYDTLVRLQYLAPAEVAGQWGTIGIRARAFLEALEARVAAPSLARQAMRTIERRLALDCADLRPVTVGSTHAARVDITKPLVDLGCPPETDRAVLTPTAKDSDLGILELPVLGGIVSAQVIADIDAATAWRLLGIFFAETVYPQLEIDETRKGVTVRRNGTMLAEGLREESTSLPALHDAIGWTVFLQELWGKESWTADAFYRRRTPDGASETLLSTGDRTQIEVADELPSLVTDAASVAVTVRVGERVLGIVTVEAREGRIEAQRLRAEITTAAGLELCRLTVVQALVGRPLGASDLRDRLRDAAPRKRGLDRAEGDSLLGRHPHAPIGSSGSRTAWLPTSIVDEVELIAELNGQPFVRGQDGAPIFYSPEVLGHMPAVSAAAVVARPASDVSARVPAYGRRHFEELLASEHDPWQHESAYERRKYAQTLELIPRQAKRALEIGCAEGHFTVELAPRVGELVSADLSEVALSRARERCSGLTNVSFAQLDIVKDPLPGRFDVIVCSELLYYVGGERLPSVARKLAGGLRPGGALVLAHANLQVDEPDEPGFDWALPYGARHIADVLGEQTTLRLVRELRTPFYRVHRFDRRPASERIGRHRGHAPPIAEDVPFDEPVPEVASTFRWTPAQGNAADADATAETWDLPILMYHRVADDGPESTARWRVGTDEFARQLAYLADAGFRTITFDQWRAAAERRMPLPGRAVVLTFDDGYEDFATNAWPLLARHGFGAVVALVSDLVGSVAEWDARYGEPARLLDWPAIRDLADQGVEFASHTATHMPLTALSVDDAARECARSRLTLERELGRRVSTLVYPHGAHDPVVEHLCGGLGYVYGLTSRYGVAAFRDPLLTLPRQEVTGNMSFREFVRSLAST